ncbi:MULTISPECIES: PAS domain-containing sensor histidine kinase [unclassified Sphingopyxis]|uniref:PAS domain-containing sensor histidine kinase n=3 Tax=unclassified Sphingopyxis TaxID=2614943 RepID=UPI0007856B50|nr:PAS domain S-box protein [Sphingopyxis sp. USTB-05]USI79475.1 PAS domain S-box protein [Sphingopyxis sp. USTB-05]
MSMIQRPFAIRLALALLFVAAAALLRYALTPWLGGSASFLLFAPAILAAAFYAGPMAASIATAPALGLGLYFAGFRDGGSYNLVEVIVFLVTAAGIVALSQAFERMRRRVHESDHRAARRDAEAALVAEELNLLIDGAQGHAIYLLDAEGRVTIWNKGAERLKGWREEEVVGKDAAIFYPPDAVAAGKPGGDLAVAAREGRLEMEDWRVRKDGSEFLADVSITALRTAGGDLRGFAKVVSDITGRRAAEEALRSQESHLRSILSTVPDAMVVIDDQGSIVSFSAAAERLFGYQEAELLGVNVSRLMPSPDRERHDAYIRRFLETGEKRIIGIGRVVFAERRDGSTFPMELSIGEASSDSHPLFTGFIRDLTERQQTEARLESLQSELIHVSRVSAMGTMASTLAHELNQPITAVTNYVEAVRDLLANPDPDDIPMIRDALDDTAKEALRAGHIVRRLRDFVARGEVEKTIEKLPVLINEAAVLGLMGAREKSVEPRFDLDPYASPVLVDKVQIQQVLINLIRNAVEAMADSPVRQLTVTSRPDQRGFVRVIVADTGPGVTPEVAEQLFTAFVSTKAEGMGLGLSICRTIVEANGGRIWMEPRTGGGTEFHFTLVSAKAEENDVG